MDRKAFINSFARLSFLGAFIFLTGFLYKRRKITSPDECSQGSFCSNCREFESCNREEAKKQRNNG